MRLPTKDETRKILERVDSRKKMLEASVQSVVQGYTYALFVWGPPGLGKSHLLTAMLDGLCQGGWRHHTAYSTAKALMIAIAESPTSIHLFEDCEKLLKTDLTASILRAACGAPGERERWVTYETANEKFRVNFTGGIVIATNANLARANGPLQGVASRFRPIQWTLTLEERLAIISDIAEQGWVRGKIRLTKAETVKVAKEMLEMVQQLGCDTEVDIRLYTEHALPTFAHCKATGINRWEDVLQSKLIGIAQTKEESQSARTGKLEVLAQMIASGPGTGKEKVADWKAKTGLGQAIYYRHLKKGKKRS